MIEEGLIFRLALTRFNAEFVEAFACPIIVCTSLQLECVGKKCEIFCVHFKHSDRNGLNSFVAVVVILDELESFFDKLRCLEELLCLLGVIVVVYFEVNRFLTRNVSEIEDVGNPLEILAELLPILAVGYREVILDDLFEA